MLVIRDDDGFWLDTARNYSPFRPIRKKVLRTGYAAPLGTRPPRKPWPAQPEGGLLAAVKSVYEYPVLSPGLVTCLQPIGDWVPSHSVLQACRSRSAQATNYDPSA